MMRKESFKEFEQYDSETGEYVTITFEYLQEAMDLMGQTNLGEFATVFAVDKLVSEKFYLAFGYSDRKRFRKNVLKYSDAYLRCFRRTAEKLRSFLANTTDVTVSDVSFRLSGLGLGKLLCLSTLSDDDFSNLLHYWPVGRYTLMEYKQLRYKSVVKEVAYIKSERMSHVKN